MTRTQTTLSGPREPRRRGHLFRRASMKNPIPEGLMTTLLVVRVWRFSRFPLSSVGYRPPDLPSDTGEVPNRPWFFWPSPSLSVLDPPPPLTPPSTPLSFFSQDPSSLSTLGVSVLRPLSLGSTLGGGGGFQCWRKNTLSSPVRHRVRTLPRQTWTPRGSKRGK